ncbi:MAG: ComEC/Rec2 family competence protein [Clostridia bacterium]|nr:ComEC/Rec2 family competence protein [Clostridia bacterium]
MKKLVNLRLALFVALSLAIGIICCYNKIIGNHSTSKWLTYGFFSLVILYVVIGNWKTKILKRLCISLSVLVFFMLGAFSFNSQVNSFENSNLNNHYFNVSGRIDGIDQTEYGVYLKLGMVKLEGFISGEQDYSIGVYANGEKHAFELGQEIEFYALLRDRSLIYEDKLAVYDISQKVKWVATVSQEEITILANKPTIFQKVNLFIKKTLFSGMDSNQASVAYALLTGQDENIPEDTLSQFRYAGVAHIFAVSGLHIGFLATVLTFLFKKLRVNRWVSLILTFCGLLFYSGVCGFSSSSIRATVMCAVLLFASNVGYRYDGLTSISISAIIILLISPIELFCAGFELSFAVVLGMLVLSPPLNKLFKFIPTKLRNSLSAVISAQVVSIPICIMIFGYTSLISVVCNLVFIPLVGIIYILTFALTIIGGLFGIPAVALFVCNYVFKGVLFFMEIFDYSIFTLAGISLGVYTVFYYLALLTISGFFNLNKAVKIIVSLLLCVAFVLCAVFDNKKINNQTNVYVIGNPNVCFTVIDSKEETVLIVNAMQTFSSTSRLKRLCERQNIQRFDAVIVGDSYAMTDLHTIAGRVRDVAPFDGFYYYGLTDVPSERAIRLSFGQNFDMANYLENQKITLKNIQCEFYNGGYVTYFKIGDFSGLAFSRFNQNPNYLGVEISSPNVVVAYDYQERIFSEYDGKCNISFCGYLGDKNAYESGTLKIRVA